MNKKESEDIKDFYKDLFPEDISDELKADIEQLKEKGRIKEDACKKALAEIAKIYPNFVFVLK